MNRNDEILSSLGEIKADVRELVRRVGVQNGRVAKMEERMDGIDVKIAESKGEARGMSKLWGIVLTLLGAAVGVLTTIVKYYKR